MKRQSFRPESIAEIGARAAQGEQGFDLAVREFLDTWQGLSPGDREGALAEEPARVGRIEDREPVRLSAAADLH